MKINSTHIYGLVGVVGVVLTILYENYDGSDEPFSDAKKQEIQLKIDELLRNDSDIISEPNPLRKEVSGYIKPIKGSYKLKEVHHTWDMRNWVKVPSVDMGKPISPVTVIGRKRLVKLEDTSEYVTSAMTSGYDVFTRCDANQFECEILADEKRVGVGGTMLKSVYTIFDTSDVNINGEFDIKYTRTFWNAFQNRDQSWVGVIGEDGVFKITFLLILPDRKILRNPRLMVAKIGEKDTYEYSGEKLVLGDADKKWMYWELVRPQKDHVYRVDWDWVF